MVDKLIAFLEQNGYEPEFEETEIVAENFSDFINKVISGQIEL